MRCLKNTRMHTVDKLVGLSYDPKKTRIIEVAKSFIVYKGEPPVRVYKEKLSYVNACEKAVGMK